MEQIETTIDGTTYAGSRSVRGSRELRQTIYFEEFHKEDSRSYSPDQTDYMLAMAKIILGELVRGYR